MKTCERCKQEQKEGEVLTYIDSGEWCWRCVEQTRHDAGKALMARERGRIVAWLRDKVAHARAPESDEGRWLTLLANNIQAGVHWREQP